jgi:hypothetical protein
MGFAVAVENEVFVDPAEGFGSGKLVVAVD